jgi:hypothetical protein
MIRILKFPYTSLVMLIPGYNMSILFAFAVNNYLENSWVCIRVDSRGGVSRPLVLESFPAKFFTDFNRHFCFAPIKRLDIVENKMAVIVLILKFPYTFFVMLIPG